MQIFSRKVLITCGVGGGSASAPPSFDLVKIWVKSLRIRAKSVKTFVKSLKIWTKSLKIRAKMAPNTVFMRKYSHKKGPKIFLGKFGEIQAKILRTPKN